MKRKKSKWRLLRRWEITKVGDEYKFGDEIWRKLKKGEEGYKFNPKNHWPVRRRGK